jgi:hypothetical protein
MLHFGRLTDLIWSDLGSILWSQFSANFANFRRKKLAFLSKTNVMINFFTIYLCFEPKTPILTSVPGHTGVHWRNRNPKWFTGETCRPICVLCTAKFSLFPFAMPLIFSAVILMNFLCNITACVCSQTFHVFYICQKHTLQVKWQ